MADSARVNPVLHYLRRLAGARNHSPLSDGQLLRRFALAHDEAAFEALLSRHGAMVLGVSRRVLRNQQDAEDVFQAAFLVLARKATSICKQGSVGSWLHGVAHRLALKVKTEAARRSARQIRCAAQPSRSDLANMTWQEIEPILDEELRQLADRYRAPLVLCYLEGKTRDEAAQQLGSSVRTVMRRLEQGRELLRGRLVRRGVTMSAALITAGLCSGTAVAGVAPALLTSTANAAVRVALGQAATGVISAKVAALTQGMISAMVMARLKVATFVLLAVGLVATGTGMVVFRASAAPVHPIALAQLEAPAPLANDEPPRAEEKEPVPTPAAPESDRPPPQKIEVRKNRDDDDDDDDRPKLQGVVKALDVSANKLTLSAPRKGKREQSFKLAKTVQVEVGGRRGTLSDLTAGMGVALELSENKKTILAVREVPSKPTGDDENGKNLPSRNR